MKKGLLILLLTLNAWADPVIIRNLDDTANTATIEPASVASAFEETPVDTDDVSVDDPLLNETNTEIDKYLPDADKSVIVVVDPKAQEMLVYKDQKLSEVYTISTALAGLGTEVGSNQTPTGVFTIASKMGDDEPVGTIFKGRVATGKIATIDTEPGVVSSTEDYVLTRVMQLQGEEPGINKGKNRDGISVDAHDRFIYIHGTNAVNKLGTPASHGCIRMDNDDVTLLFDDVKEGTIVYIANNL